MKHRVLWGLTGFYLLIGLYMIISPRGFYEHAPGVSETGPYNRHFLFDVGFAFTVSALGIAFGLRKHMKPVIILGTGWLAMHGLFHLVLWIGHPHPGSVPALVDLVVVVLPAIALSYLSATYKEPQDA